MGGTHEGAYLAFVQTRSSQLRRFAYLLCGDWQRAEDHTQEALIRMYVKWKRIEPDGRFAYARQCVTRLVIDESRRARSRERPGLIADHPDPRADASAETRWDLERALAQLPPKRRACVVLRYFDDLSVEETAKVMGIAQGTVKSQTLKAMAQLRELLSPEFLPASATMAGRPA